METLKNIEQKVYAGIFDMGGMPVRQAFPAATLPNVDPFVLLHHAEITVPHARNGKKVGVGPHPHRGFSPVTFIYKGAVFHKDSAGHAQAVYEGGAQWIHAGSGIMHSERPIEEALGPDRKQEIIQLWVNTPAKHKMDPPSYFPVQKEGIPTISMDGGKITFSLVSGEWQGIQGPVPNLSPMVASPGHIQKGAEAFIPVSENHQVFLYALDGLLTLNHSVPLEGKHGVSMGQEGNGFWLKAEEDTRVLFLSGVPIGEKIAMHGPFVMNTQRELMEAMDDFYAGKMGHLED